ncbi:MAG: CsiV family protein [Cycloclasticus sp.]|nr:CsiV family protein [Cycloclasticus sp.]
MILLKHVPSFFIAFLLAYSSVGHTEDKTQWYSIEYIVFEHTLSNNQTPEVWTKEPLKMPDHALDLDYSHGNSAFSPLAVNQQQLHGVFARLKQLSSYTPLQHGGWIQPARETDTPKGVKIVRQIKLRQLEGSITFNRSRYLHLDIDLQLSEFAPLIHSGVDTADDAINSPTLYRLKESRRVKTTESNYFDHPRFGVIALVKAIDSPQAAVTTNDLNEEKQLEAGHLETLTPSSSAKNQ